MGVSYFIFLTYVISYGIWSLTLFLNEDLDVFTVHSLIELDKNQGVQGKPLKEELDLHKNAAAFLLQGTRAGLEPRLQWGRGDVGPGRTFFPGFFGFFKHSGHPT